MTPYNKATFPTIGTSVRAGKNLNTASYSQAADCRRLSTVSPSPNGLMSKLAPDSTHGTKKRKTKVPIEADHSTGARRSKRDRKETNFYINLPQPPSKNQASKLNETCLTTACSPQKDENVSTVLSTPKKISAKRGSGKSMDSPLVISDTEIDETEILGTAR